MNLKLNKKNLLLKYVTDSHYSSYNSTTRWQNYTTLLIGITSTHTTKIERGFSEIGMLFYGAFMF